MKVGRLLLRAAVGGVFVGHGTQKLFGWFGGDGLKATSVGFDAMGLKPGTVNASATAAAETLGGAGLVLGYGTPLASALVVAPMITAIQRVHGKNGPWANKGGYEYNAVLIAAALALAEAGPGTLSLDALRGKQKTGVKWLLASAALGAAGAAGGHFLIESKADPAPAGDEAAAAPAASANGSDPVAAPAPAEPVAEVAESDEATEA